MDPDARPTAKEVGDAFAELYYRVLQDHPSQLHKFYKDDSNVSRPRLDGIMRYFTFSDIDEHDLNMLYSGEFSSVELTSVISQDSLDGSVFVTVDGYFHSKERRCTVKFIQIFFLAPQENGGYYAYNDLFRLIDISEAPTYNVIEENVPETEEVADESSRVEDVSKTSDASVVPIGQGQHASSSDHSPEIKTDAVEDGTGNNQESQASTDECSTVFVKRLPPNVTSDMMENTFKQFGPIKKGGISIKHPGLDYYYAFVNFEEADAAKKAVMVRDFGPGPMLEHLASPVLVGGRKVPVAKKLGTITSSLREWKKSMEEQMKIRYEARKL